MFEHGMNSVPEQPMNLGFPVERPHAWNDPVFLALEQLEGQTIWAKGTDGKFYQVTLKAVSLATPDVLIETSDLTRQFFPVISLPSKDVLAWQDKKNRIEENSSANGQEEAA